MTRNPVICYIDAQLAQDDLDAAGFRQPQQFRMEPVRPEFDGFPFGVFVIVIGMAFYGATRLGGDVMHLILGVMP